MRRLHVIVAAFLLCGAVVSVRAQKGDSALVTVDEFRAPSSPAFTILGIEPSSIERPSTFKRFAVLLGAMRPKDGLVPHDVAVEVAPYWLTSRPDLTFDEFNDPTFVQSLQQSFAISLGSTTSRVPSDSGTDMALGVRMMLVPGRGHPDLATLRDSIEQVQLSIGEDTLAPADEEAALRRLKELARRVQALGRERQGVQLELAAGGAWSFPSDHVDRGRLSAVGGWLTVGYRWADPEIHLLGAVRYFHQARVPGDGDQVDLGLRCLWKQGPFALSMEYVHRNVIDASFSSPPGGPTTAYVTFASTARYAGNLTYRLGDQMSLTATLGKDFSPVISGGEDLLSGLALQYDLGPIVNVLRR